MSSAARIIFYISTEEKMRFCNFCYLCLEMLWVSPIYFISFSMRVVIWDYVEGLYRSQLSEFSHGFCGLKNGVIFSWESMLAGMLRVFFCCSEYMFVVVWGSCLHKTLIYVAWVKSSFNEGILWYDGEQVPIVSVNMLSCLNMLSISFYFLTSYIAIRL